MTTMKILIDDLSSPEIAALLSLHLATMASVSPPESCHALNLDALRQPHIRFWSAWDNDELAGCGALQTLSPEHAELKSMRTVEAYQRQGVAAALLGHILQEARQSGITRISLETGTMDYFLPARRLYERFGFTYCAPFGDYVEDPHSVFMTRHL
jgi:putative acetyltransferase